jgi:dihydroflavonol-4-reductase
VAVGTLAAALQGRTGEAYLLDNHGISNVELCAIVAKHAGVRAPLFALPLWLARVLSYGGLLWERVTGRRALLTPYAVHTISKDFSISNEKARRELNFAPRPLEQTLHDAWTWLATDPHSPLVNRMRVGPARQALPPT